MSIFRQKFNFPKNASNVVEMFLLMSGTNNLAKKYFRTPFWDSTKFSLFCKVRACRFSFFQKLPQNVVEMFLLMSGTNNFAKKYFLSPFWEKFNFPKTASNVVEMFLLMSGTNNFAKKYFLSPFWESTNFSLFCKVRACRFSVKISIFQKLPKKL